MSVFVNKILLFTGSNFIFAWRNRRLPYEWQRMLLQHNSLRNTGLLKEKKYGGRKGIVSKRDEKETRGKDGKELKVQTG
jgi:hypothetical protein